MPIQKGDIVAFLNDVGGGKVIQVDEERKRVWVETEDGFPIGPLPLSEVISRTKPNDYPLRMKAPEQPITKPTSQRQSKGDLVIDLHINALPTKGAGMDDVAKHKYQLQYFRLQMAQNLRYRGKRLVFIHGKGDGTLKNEVRQILKREYAGKVEFHDADFSKYEDGATLVIIK